MAILLSVLLAACTPSEANRSENPQTPQAPDTPGPEDPDDPKDPVNPDDSEGAEAGTYEIVFSSFELANQEPVSLVSQDGIKVEFSDAKWFDNAQSVRAYSGSTVTVSSAKEISSIVFYFGKDDKDNAITADCGSYAEPQWTGSSGKVVFTIDGTSGHRRISSMTVTLSDKDADKQEGDDPPTPGDTTPGTDVLTVSFTGVRSGGTYYKWSDKKGSESSAVYAGDTANFQDKAIQMNNSDHGDYGIITTASGGRVSKISVKWDDKNYAGVSHTLNVYGSNSAYTEVNELYSAASAGTLLGTIVYGSGTELTVTGNYAFVGLRSDDNALYFNEIRIVWE